MKTLDITVGRTSIRALLVAAVLTAGIVGGVGTAAAEPIDGKGDDPSPDDLYMSLDGEGNDPLPTDLYASLDGKGNDVRDGEGTDVLTTAFPIDNVTVSVDCAGRGGGSGKADL
jgi:hypothetical protein